MIPYKPQNIEEYNTWLQFQHNININKTRKWYELVSRDIKDKFEDSIFWKELLKKFHTYAYDYKEETKYELLMPEAKPEVIIKKFNSVLSKCLRFNILNNKNWPDPPEEGWILPENWFSRINDIIRTRIIVRYLDGVEYLIPRIKVIAEENGFVYDEPIFKSEEEGYYAVHLYICNTFEISKIDFDTYETEVKIEIQLTTQLQEIICKLLHKYYEEKRDMTKEKNEIPWQWDYQNNEFATNYLGHILHYIEGMIVDIRKKQEED